MMQAAPPPVSVPRIQAHVAPAQAVSVEDDFEADHMLAQFDRALSVRGLAILQSVATAEEWETMTRGRRNMAPVREAQQQTTVNVTQLFFTLAEIDTNPMPEWRKQGRSRGVADPVGGY